jgi:hypothetical protein
MPGGGFGCGRQGLGSTCQTPKTHDGPANKVEAKPRKAFPNHAYAFKVERILKGLASMIILVGLALLVAVLAFGIVPLMVAWIVMRVTRYLTGRD